MNRNELKNMVTSTSSMDLAKFRNFHLNVFSLVNDPYSCVKCIRKTVHIALLPAYIGNESKGVLDILSGWTLQYVKSLNGILLSYKNVSFVQNSGAILYDQPHIHHDVSADFYTFQPQIASILKGTVNKISKMHVSCVVHGCINVSLPLSQDSNVDALAQLFIGQDILFQVETIETNLRIMRVQGSIIEQSFDLIQEIPKPVVPTRKVNGYSVADDIPISFESETEIPDTQTGTPVNKLRSKHASDENDTVVFLPEEQVSRKHKKHKLKFQKQSDDIRLSGESWESPKKKSNTKVWDLKPKLQVQKLDSDCSSDNEVSQLKFQVKASAQYADDSLIQDRTSNEKSGSDFDNDLFVTPVQKKEKKHKSKRLSDEDNNVSSPVSMKQKKHKKAHIRERASDLMLSSESCEIPKKKNNRDLKQKLQEKAQVFGSNCSSDEAGSQLKSEFIASDSDCDSTMFITPVPKKVKKSKKKDANRESNSFWIGTSSIISSTPFEAKVKRENEHSSVSCFPEDLKTEKSNPVFQCHKSKKKKNK